MPTQFTLAEELTPGDAPQPRRHRPEDGVLLQVEDLHVEFRTREGVARAINGVDFSLSQGETLAVLGESGSGKSVTAQTLMRILDTPPGHITGGRVLYCGTNLVRMSERQMREIRARRSR